MDAVDHFVWLGIQAVGLFFHLWFISGPLTLLFVAALVWLAKHRPVSLGARLTFWTALLFPIAVLIYGNAFEADTETGPESPLAEWVLNASALASLALYAYVIAKAPGQRLASLTIAAFGAWLTLCALFVAGMAVTGDWL